MSGPEKFRIVMTSTEAAQSFIAIMKLPEVVVFYFDEKAWVLDNVRTMRHSTMVKATIEFIEVKELRDGTS